MKKAPGYPLLKPYLDISHHGINVPLFALRTQNSSGIGEFLDLIPLLDWMASIGLNVLQLLPLNDSALDPSPYNAISSCALHPIYLSLYDLPFLGDHKEKLGDFQKYMKPKKVPYRDVLSAKRRFMEGYFLTSFPEISKTEEYNTYIEKNHYWLDEFVLFKTLKEHYGDISWMDWPKDIQEPTHTIIKQLRHQFEKEIAYHTLVQYLCHTQLSRVHQYAKKKGISLKGDIPILISPDSCDVWMNHHEFDLSLAAGAPPDVFNSEGQYWGFPLFRWDIMREDDFTWWKRRLKLASHYYDIYRIDHIIGFFRIWAIPRGAIPIEGTYIPETNDLVILQGSTILEMMMKSCPMLPIGEDLGIMPCSIYSSLRELGICGTKVLRWEKDRATNREFIPYDKYFPLSMTSVSTHDSETLQLWWEAYPEEARAFSKFNGWDYHHDLSRDRHREILLNSHHTSSFFHINLFQEYLYLFPELTWDDPEDERINYPGFILPQNWTYRFRPYLEQFTSHIPLHDEMKKLIA